ncbi:unnamed protein product [Staurois parvus]|uniref:Uncharacterized protein n=1 Tax=Staurois parvus TaxID=386267 RepID=A0ABN9C7R8_9NEOB|nr:unnamed protein product [Staurois parvus]
MGHYDSHHYQGCGIIPPTDHRGYAICVLPQTTKPGAFSTFHWPHLKGMILPNDHKCKEHSSH